MARSTVIMVAPGHIASNAAAWDNHLITTAVSDALKQWSINAQIHIVDAYQLPKFMNDYRPNPENTMFLLLGLGNCRTKRGVVFTNTAQFYRSNNEKLFRFITDRFDQHLTRMNVTNAGFNDALQKTVKSMWCATMRQRPQQMAELDDYVRDVIHKHSDTESLIPPNVISLVNSLLLSTGAAYMSDGNDGNDGNDGTIRLTETMTTVVTNAVTSAGDYFLAGSNINDVRTHGTVALTDDSTDPQNLPHGVATLHENIPLTFDYLINMNMPNVYMVLADRSNLDPVNNGTRASWAAHTALFVSDIWTKNRA